MKQYKSIRTSLFILLIAFSGCFMAACGDEVNTGKTTDDKYQPSNGNIGYIVNNDGKRGSSIVEFRNEGNTSLYVNLLEEVAQNVNIAFKYDQTVLDAYNQANGTNYSLFPQALVSFNNGNSVQVSAGNNKSAPLSVTMITDAALELNTTYVIPLKAESQSGGIKLADKESNYLIFVKDYSKIPSTDKSTGIKIFNCIEANNTNPLNSLCFTLKNSGTLLIDAVILFSSNMNYSDETGRVYVYNNENIQHILDNREKYLKPLQDRGIKVILSILGNHDRAAVNNLSDETARLFAKELKVLCDTYKLDGVFFDDEYSNPIYPAPPGFVNPSYEAAARLVYETKKAMPDKLTVVYAYSGTGSFSNPVDGHDAGSYVDWALHDYRQGFDLSANYPGLPKTRWGMYSGEYALNRYPTTANLNTLKNGGYGGHMIFAMDPTRDSNWTRQKTALDNIATYLFNDVLVYDGKPYKKDW